MCATRNTEVSLAGRHTDREVFSPIRTARGLADRLAAGDRKLAFLRLFENAKPKPDWYYQLTRSEPRQQVPGERHRDLIVAGIRAGHISEDQIIAYCRGQLLDLLGQFPTQRTADETVYVALMTETAEMVEAHTIARALPSPATQHAAIAQTRDVIALGQIVVAGSQRQA